MQARSLRPHTLVGHRQSYKSVLHHYGDTTPAWLLEAVGLFVSALNDCRYCRQHPCQGMRRLLQNDTRAFAVREALSANCPDQICNETEMAMLSYAETLTRNPGAVSEDHIAALRSAGLGEGEILELNQMVSYFDYANRVATGLGVETAGEVLGLAPVDAHDPDNWKHA